MVRFDHLGLFVLLIRLLVDICWSLLVSCGGSGWVLVGMVGYFNECMVVSRVRGVIFLVVIVPCWIVRSWVRVW